MSNSGYTTPDQPIRSRTPATPRRRSLRATEEDYEDFRVFDAMVARNPVPVLAVPPRTPVRQNAIRLDITPPAAPRRIFGTGPRRVMMAAPPGDEPVPVTPPAAPRRRARSPHSSPDEPVIKRPRFEE